MKKNKLFSNRLFWHILFWTIRLLFFGIVWGIEDDDYQVQFFRELFDLPAEMLVVYTMLYVLFPHFLVKKKYVSFVLSLVGVLLIGAILKRATFFFFYYPVFYPESERLVAGMWEYFAINRIVFTSVFTSSIAFAALAIRLMRHWYYTQRAIEGLAKEKLEAELNFLKAQIHPHFLFNTLNNIYGLALRNDAHTPEVVLKLSRLLNYMLYDCRAPLVPLAKELEYVEDYIALEQMRYGDRLDVSLKVSGDMLQGGVAPMLMLTFVENSFKHGVSSQLDRAWIKIDLNVKSGNLHLLIENSKSEEHEQSKVQDAYHKGIGLKNVKRRLDLIYGDSYELEFQNTATRFSVSLMLPLSHEGLAVPLSPIPIHA